MKALLLGLGVVLMTLGPASTTMARSDADREAVRVDPATVGAGESATFAGTGLLPGSALALVLVGGHLEVGLGAVRTDASGRFNTVVDIPSHLPGGSYELRAIGDETVVAGVTVTAAAAGGAPAGVPTTSGAAAPADTGISTGVAVTLGLAALTVAASLLVAWRAEGMARLARTGR